MKSRSIGSLILLAILAPSCGGGGGGGGGFTPGSSNITPRWVSQFRTPTTSNLRAVVFANATTGIVAGEDGTFIRTNDGGATWEQLEYTPANRGGNVLAISVALTTALAVGSDAATGGSAAWTSFDATNWTIPDDTSSRFAQPWVDVNVVVPSSGGTPNASYRLRPNGMVDVYQGGFQFSLDSTSNGTPGTFPWTSANGVTFFGISGYGLVCGSNGSGNGEIHRSSDGGHVWDVLTLSGGPYPPLEKFAMQAPTSGFVCGDQGTILHTVDGVNWTPLNNKPAAASGINFHAIIFPLNASVGWAVGDAGTIYNVTELGGNWTWTLQASTTTQNLYGVSFIDNMTGYAAGDKGTVLKTTNGGTSWTNISQPPEASAFPQINAVDFDPTGQIGLAVGNGGLVLRTLDGGNTWVDFNTNVGGANLTGVCIPRSGSGQVAYLCGAGNTILSQSALQGAASSAWVAPGAPPSGSFEAIFFPKGDKNGVCVGGTTVLFTSDGATWSAPATAPSGTFHALAASPGGTTLYAAGNGGVIYSSVDDPATPVQDIGHVWTVIPNPMTPTYTPSLLSIQAPTGPSYTLFAAGNDGFVYRLSAGATPTWTQTTPQSSTTPVSLAFINDHQGWVVTQGATGGIFSTVTGGTIWARSYLHVTISTTNNLRAIVMNSSEVGYAVGDGGMIMKTTTGGQ